MVLETFFVAVLLLLFTVRGTVKLVLLNLPSTVAHELAHWAVGVVTASSPSFPSLLPRQIGKGTWQLGEVSFLARNGYAAWVALAPLFLLLVVFWVIFQRSASETLSVEAGWGIACGFLAWGSLPSSQDWSIALKYPLGAASAMTAFCLAGYFLLG